MINNQRGRMLSTNIPINTLSGGVGRQAPSKRLPTEAQELSNMMVTVERSMEKRPGVEVMKLQNLDGDNPNNYNFEKLGLPTTAKPDFFWHSLSDDARYLIVVDRAAVQGVDKLFYVYFFNQTTDIFENHTQEIQDSIDADLWAYLVYEPDTPLEFVAKGQNLVFLNTMVQAGYTSRLHTLTAGETLDGAGTDAGDTAWCMLGLDGQFKTTGDPKDYTSDPKGLEVTYTTSTLVDPQGIAVYWDSYSSYARGTEVLVLPGQHTDNTGPTSTDNGLHSNGPIPNTAYYILQAVAAVVAPNAELGNKNNWVVVATTDSNFTLPTYNPPLPALDPTRTPVEIDVKNWIYPDSSKPQYGQSVPTFADIKFPPPEVDVTSGNNGAEAMLAALYGLNNPAVPPYTNSAEGKIYYVNAGYQGNTPGYYLMKSVTSPHTIKVRTPDAYSVLDPSRMPVELEFAGVDNGKTLWEWSTLDWEHRTSGTLDTNPGPSPFKDGKTAALKTVAFFRDRLWFSASDIVFSSRASDYTDLWLDDPGLLIDSDPIDIAASSNKYTPITAMVPFNEYMFVNTNADTQYELMGSQNQITPFTAELQPMTFYSTAPLVKPRTLGNNIFFYDKQRLYLYLGRGGSLSTAVELSQHCPNYLPSNYGAVAVATAQDTMIAADADIPGRLVMYTTRYRGDQVLQNAFYEHKVTGDPLSMNVWENDLYMVNKLNGEYTIQRLNMRQPEEDVPRLDNRQSVALYFKDTPLDASDVIDPALAVGYNAFFNEPLGQTTIRLPYRYVEDGTTIVSSTDFGTSAFVSGTIIPGSVIEGAGYTELTIKNVIQITQPADGSRIWVGTDYTSYAELSQQFVRDGENNPQEGVLNLASMITRHFDTGNYDIITQRRGRLTTDIVSDYAQRESIPALRTAISTFAATQSDTSVDSNLTLPNIEYQGELTSKILGFSDKVRVFIASDYWTPMNITNITIRGKFKQTSSSVL